MASKPNTRVVFVSSLFSVQGLATETTVPEAPVENALVAVNIGYGQYKLAAEQTLISTNRQSGVPVSIARIGQVGGPSRTAAGAWAEQPWISAIIRTSKTLGCIPSPVAPIDRIPVETVASMLESFTLQPAHEEPHIYNVVSDKVHSWILLVDVLRKFTVVSEVIPLGEWASKLRSISDPSPQPVANLPALKMLDFYEILGSGTEYLRYATDHAKEVSGVEIPIVDKELLLSWLKDWSIRG